jgi:DNA-binding NarL/FixJ family response regulator
MSSGVRIGKAIISRSNRLGHPIRYEPSLPRKERKHHIILYGTRTLSPTMIRIVDYMTLGLINKDIAVKMCTTEAVVKNYVKIIYDRLGFSNRVEVALWCLKRREESLEKEGLCKL